MYFYDWYNNIIDNVNSIDDDADVESRSMKLNGHAGRLSLIFQIMKWAVGEEDMQPVSLSSVKSAIRMVDYYEDTYHRIQEYLSWVIHSQQAMLSLLRKYMKYPEEPYSMH